MILQFDPKNVSDINLLFQQFFETSEKQFKGQFPLELIVEKNIILSEILLNDPNKFKRKHIHYPMNCKCLGGIQLKKEIVYTKSPCKNCLGSGIRTEHCKNCKGTGKKDGKNCPICRGKGRYQFFKSKSRKEDKPCSKCQGRGSTLVESKIGYRTEWCFICDGLGFSPVPNITDEEATKIAEDLLEIFIPREDLII
jgi:DnaJ-class molecular chaperone